MSTLGFNLQNANALNPTYMMPSYKQSGDELYDTLRNTKLVKSTIAKPSINSRLDELAGILKNPARYTAESRLNNMAKIQTRKLAVVAGEYDNIYNDYQQALTEYEQRGGDKSGLERAGGLMADKLLQYTETLVQGAVASGAQNQLKKIEERLAKYGGGAFRNSKLFSQLSGILKNAGKAVGAVSEATIALDLFGSSLGAVNLGFGIYNTENHTLPNNEVIDVIQDIPIINDLFNAGFEVYANMADAFDIIGGQRTEEEIKGYLKYRLQVDEHNLEIALNKELNVADILTKLEGSKEGVKAIENKKQASYVGLIDKAKQIIADNHLNGDVAPNKLYALSGYNDELTRIMWASLSNDQRVFNDLKNQYNQTYATNTKELNKIIDRYL